MSHAIQFSDETALKKAFAHYPSGIAALAARVDGADHVIIVASFSVGVSLDPPLVAFAVQRQSTTWPLLRRGEKIGVSILAAGQGDLCRRLSSKDKTQRWQGVEVDRTASDAILISESALSFECSIHAEYPAGDHEMILLRIESLNARAECDPLVFHSSRFRALEAIA